ncbi:TM2 domain-containing protein almondex [Aethina tumida]|uniref:TM2 domain-containing protein almondex n=1 Tax=Aethina tumida TaxID=116153 RepID=UPI00096AFB17|nr:TM2 domain-containing protein almondex [Aethina tumida]
MRCVHINIRRATFILLSFLVNNVHRTEMAEESKTEAPTAENLISKGIPDMVLHCPSNSQCKDLNYPCISCTFNYSCIYGKDSNASCSVLPQVVCLGDRQFNRTFNCRYCYQTPHWQHDCVQKAHCSSASSPRNTYISNCTVKSDILCLGRRSFNKNVKCNWTRGHSWSTALALSITLGGFGADRFYLGQWQEGIGKLFSFGGLGVWTIIDVILISLHYLGPSDGSLYI